MSKRDYKIPMIVPDQSFVMYGYQHWFENGIELKECLACGKPEPLSEFTKNKNTKDGLQRRCSDCKNRIWREDRARRKLQSS